MSDNADGAQVQFRVQLSADLRDRLKTASARRGWTMTDLVAVLVSNWLAAPFSPNDTRPDRAATDKDVPETKIHDRLSKLAYQIEDAKNYLGGISTSCHRETRAHISKINSDPAQQLEEAKRWAQLIDEISSITDAASILNQRALDRIADHHRSRLNLYHIGVAGVVSGLTMAAFILCVLQGTPVGRMLAVEMAGAETRIGAARLLVGEGNPYRGAMVGEIAALVENREFGRHFAQCIERAKKAGQTTQCTVRMPHLVER